MNFAIKHLSQALKKVREEKNLSQRALSLKTGLTQAQISKIENAAVDPKLSSLIEMSRALEFELMLVPCRNIAAVTSLIKLSDFGKDLAVPAYSLDNGDDDE